MTLLVVEEERLIPMPLFEAVLFAMVFSLVSIRNIAEYNYAVRVSYYQVPAL